MADVPIDQAEIQSARLVLGSGPPPTPPSGHGQVWADEAGLLRLLRSSGNDSPAGFGVRVGTVEVPDATSETQDVVVDLAANVQWNTEDVTFSDTNIVLGADGLYLKVIEVCPNNNLNTDAQATIIFPVWPGDMGPYGGVILGNVLQPRKTLFVECSPSYAGDVWAITMRNPRPQLALQVSPLRIFVARIGSLPPGW